MEKEVEARVSSCCVGQGTVFCEAEGGLFLFV